MRIFTAKKEEVQAEQVQASVKDIRHNGLRWIDIIKPTKKEIDLLEREFHFHELLLEDCMTEHQRPKVDDYDDYCFIVLHLPRYKKDLFRLDAEEVDIFIGSDYIITLHEGELKPLTTFAERCAAEEAYRKEYMDERAVLLLYEIIKRLFDYCFPMLDKIGQMIDDINKNVFRDRSKAMLENISRMKMQVINCRMVIKPLRPVILTLEKVIRKYIPEDMEIYFDDITDKNEQIWNMLENYKEVIEALDSTFSSLTNQRINNLMRTFTLIQVVILPMVLVSGLFSMNVKGIPMHSYPMAFWVVFGMIFIPTGIISLILYFKKNDWL
ncbi:MAG TPA: magnesium transporter CorA family protein [Bacillota bacterium]|nr:magnesium transporter CorA family protein [Bacillota bacterium]